MVISKSRTESLSDGLFAIILTLLILELKTPQLPPGGLSNIQLAKALWSLTPKIVSWINSYLVITVIWVNHHRLLEMLKGMNYTLFWMNAILLMCISFIPFPTALIGDYPDNSVAVSFYGFVMVLVSLGFYNLRRAIQCRSEMLKDHIDKDVFKRDTKRVVFFGPTLYSVGAGLAWISPKGATWIYFALAIYFLFPNAVNEGKVKA